MSPNDRVVMEKLALKAYPPIILESGADANYASRAIWCAGFEVATERNSEIIEVAEYAKQQFEVINSKGFKHMTAWQRLRDALAGAPNRTRDVGDSVVDELYEVFDEMGMIGSRIEPRKKIKEILSTYFRRLRVDYGQ